MPKRRRGKGARRGRGSILDAIKRRAAEPTMKERIERHQMGDEGYNERQRWRDRSKWAQDQAGQDEWARTYIKKYGMEFSDPWGAQAFKQLDRPENVRQRSSAGGFWDKAMNGLASLATKQVGRMYGDKGVQALTGAANSIANGNNGLLKNIATAGTAAGGVLWENRERLANGEIIKSMDPTQMAKDVAYDAARQATGLGRRRRSRQQGMGSRRVRIHK